MTRRDRSIDLLLRVRGLERDVQAAAHERATRERDRLERSAHQGEETMRSLDRDLARLQKEGLVGSLWRSMLAGMDAARARARALREAAARAHADQAESASQRLRAERSVAGLERLVEGRSESQRAREKRADQRRLDESAVRRPGRLCALLLLLGTSVLAQPSPAWGQAEPPVGGASLERLLLDIRARTAELDRRSAEIVERERAVAELEGAVTERIRELEELARQVEAKLGAWEEANGARSVGKLARIYAEMPARRAAELVEELDLELATFVLAKMKPKQSAAVLPLLSEDRALTISRFVGHPLGIAAPPPAPEEP